MEKFKFENREQYLKTLDSVLPESYVQHRNTGSGTHKYIPIAIQEAIADDIFQYWHVIDEQYAYNQNQIVSTVKLQYMPSYPGAEEFICTGSAGAPLGTAKNALEYKVPGTRSEAIGNALQTLGNIFGRNLSRKLNANTSLPNDFKIRTHATNQPEQDTADAEPTTNTPF